MKPVDETEPSRVGPAAAAVSVRPVLDDQWEIVAWLWQLFRHDLASVVNGLPYGDGRYQAAKLTEFPSPDGAGYLAWRAHPKTGEDAPVGFAVVDGIQGDRRSVVAFWVAPLVRREGVGRRLAIDVLSRHDGPWSIGFQHDNVSAGRFWRDVADETFGPGRWAEEQRPVPGRPDVPPDHFIEFTHPPMASRRHHLRSGPADHPERRGKLNS
jgi:predicted acetyltransferase